MKLLLDLVLVIRSTSERLAPYPEKDFLAETGGIEEVLGSDRARRRE